MNIPFDIGSGNGPVIFEPIRTMEQVRELAWVCLHGCMVDLVDRICARHAQAFACT